MTQTAQDDPLLGRVINGKFRVLDVIGRGATGLVYRAENVALGSTVALKVLHSHRQNDRRLAERFEREARATGRLNHANCISVLDYGTDETGLMFMAMEYVHGISLQDTIDSGSPIKLRRLVHIVTQALGALDEAHANGIIHCDLKPENIILEERAGDPDFVKVLDFGVAEAEDGPEGSRQVAGTPEYMSPEQARNEKLDGRSDLYAVGVIMYQMVTGDVPFRGVSPLAIVTRHLNEQVEPPSLRRPEAAIDSSLERLILQCLSKDRDGRPEHASALAHMLQDLLPHGSVDTTGRVTMSALDDHQRKMTRVSATKQVRSSKARSKKKFVLLASIAGFAILVLAAILIAVLAGGDDKEATGSEAKSDEASTDDEKEAESEGASTSGSAEPGDPIEEGGEVAGPGDSVETDDSAMTDGTMDSAPEDVEETDASDSPEDGLEDGEVDEDAEKQKRRERRKKRREKEKAEADAGGGDDALTKRMLASAEKSLREGNIENAARLIERVLARDKNNKKAKRLKSKISKM